MSHGLVALILLLYGLDPAVGPVAASEHGGCPISVDIQASYLGNSSQRLIESLCQGVATAARRRALFHAPRCSYNETNAIITIAAVMEG